MELARHLKRRWNAWEKVGRSSSSYNHHHHHDPSPLPLPSSHSSSRNTSSSNNNNNNKTTTTTTPLLRSFLSWGLIVVTLLLVGNMIIAFYLDGGSGLQDLFHTLLPLSLTTGGVAARAARQDVPLPHKAKNYVLYDCASGGSGGGGCSTDSLLILQTSDGERSSSYARMLDALQSVHLAYAAQWGFSYLRWDGLAKGQQSWHATYNRIFLLNELYRKGKYQWVLFVDPDGIIRDPRLSVADLLDDRYAVIGCRGGDDETQFWDINIGVAFFNLRHPRFGELIRQWLWQIRLIPNKKLTKGGGTDAYVSMGKGPHVRDDQQMFHELIAKHPQGPKLVKRYFGEGQGGDSYLFNYKEGKYVAHLIRADNKDQDKRFLELLQLKANFFANLASLEEERVDAARRAMEKKKEMWEEREGGGGGQRRREQEGGGGGA